MDYGQYGQSQTGKSKKIIIIVVIAVLVVGLAGYFGYSKFIKNDNSDSPNTIKGKINSELENTVSFAIKDYTKLIAITSDGKEVLLYDSAEGNIEYEGNIISAKNEYGDFHYDFDATDNMIYMYLISINKEKYLASIDLKNGNGNYVPKVITKVELTEEEITGYSKYNGEANIVKIGQYIYLSNKFFFKYDLQNKKMNYMNIVSNGTIFWLLKYNNNIIYNDEYNIYYLDVSNDQSKLILSNSLPVYAYDNFLAYYYFGYNSGTSKVDVNTDDSYYLYDITNNKKTKISKYLKNTGSDLEKYFIIPFDNSVYSFDGLDLYKYNNKLEKAYSFKYKDFDGIVDDCTDQQLGGIYRYAKISADELLIEFYYGEGKTFNIIYNVNTKKIGNANGRNAEVYDEIYYLK